MTRKKLRMYTICHKSNSGLRQNQFLSTFLNIAL